MSEEEFDPRSLERAVREGVRRERAELQFATSEEYPGRLRELLESLGSTTQFQRGDLVRWKEGLQNKTVPLEFSIGIVVEVLSEPFTHPEAESGSQYFREPLDIAIASIMGEERQFVIFWYDSRRFELVNNAN